MSSLYKSDRSIIQNYVVYGEHNGTLSPAFVHCHQMEVSGKSHNWHIKPHIHSHLFQIHIMEEGKMLFTGERMQVELTKPFILTIPENTLHGFKQEKGTKGTVISLSYILMEEILQHHPQGLKELDEIQLFQKTEDNEWFENVFLQGRLIDKELKKDGLGKEVMIRCLVGELLIKILRMRQNNKPNNLSLENNLNYKHFKTFQNAIKHENSSRKQIKEYARELQMTPVHLNRICQSIVGKSALQVVQDYIIIEAKRHLLYSSYTIAEVSHLLNFKDPNYFSRYFKKSTGMTPKAFRKQKKSF